MTVFIKNLYGINNKRKAYFRKQGNGCFDFVNQKKFASNLTKEEVEKILTYSDFYKNTYKASEIGTEE